MPDLNELFLADDTATRQAGARLAAVIGNELPVIYLHGTLGAGKTTFSQGFLASLGVGGVVRSPTYTLVEPYQTSKGEWLHCDLYRIADPAELEWLGLLDVVPGRTGLLVEWPQHGQGFLQKPDLEISLQLLAPAAVATAHTAADSGRKLSWQARTPLGEELLKALAKL